LSERDEERQEVEDEGRRVEHPIAFCGSCEEKVKPQIIDVPDVLADGT
jgi:hypothetical protein